MLSIVVTHYSHTTRAWHGIDLYRLSPFREVIQHILQYEGASLVYPETWSASLALNLICVVKFSHPLINPYPPSTTVLMGNAIRILPPSSLR